MNIERKVLRISGLGNERENTKGEAIFCFVFGSQRRDG